MPDDTVTLDKMTAAWLTHNAFVHLWYAAQDEGCCPTCCGVCAGLKDLHQRGMLSDLLRPYEKDGNGWWSDQGGVDYEAMQAAWRLTECHDHDHDSMTVTFGAGDAGG